MIPSAPKKRNSDIHDQNSFSTRLPQASFEKENIEIVALQLDPRAALNFSTALDSNQCHQYSATRTSTNQLCYIGKRAGILGRGLVEDGRVNDHERTDEANFHCEFNGIPGRRANAILQTY